MKKKFFTIALLLGSALARIGYADEVKIVTYYPAPYGEYKELRVLDDAYLAYSGSQVSIGTLTPAPGAKLTVQGMAQVTGFKMPTGAQSGYVMTSDAAGAGTWKPGGGSLIFGAVRLDGAIMSGTGFAVTPMGPGQYGITFTPPFQMGSIVVLPLISPQTQQLEGGVPYQVTGRAPSSGGYSVDILIYDVNNSPKNASFCFVAVPK